jgi:opacity protein-like surface antigen
MKAKSIFLIIVIVVLSMRTANASADNNQENDFHRIQIGVNFSPDYCYRTLSGNNNGMRDEIEEARFGYTGGLVINFNLNKVFGIESGIQYSDKGFRTKKRDLHIDLIDGSYEWWQRDVYHFYYIEVPLKARFVIGEQKVRFLLVAGLSPGFLVRATTTTQYSYGRTRTLPNDAENYNRLNLFSTVGIGIDYKITPKSNIRIAPTYRYGLLNTSKSREESGFISESENLWSVGVNLSYLIGIK